MSPERWHHVKEIVGKALDRPPEDRARFVEVSCGEDAPLVEEVWKLLSSEPEDDFLSVSPHAAWEGTDACEHGELVGPYRILREIAHGGMGTVYQAEREDDAFRRTVAVKVLRRGSETAELVRRFRNERQILASIDHPYIAKLHDGGTTKRGHPFFVMEYIDGKPIDRYCDEEGLSVDARLDLFGKVCSAVELAHRNLVVHRDLKPANILVTPEGEPKLLDFGIAKLLSSDLSAQTMDVTRQGVLLMTPEYASPEQARGGTVTTASDVYSLGIILYELLTGRRPYEFESRDITHITRVICEKEPSRPSAVVDVTANGRPQKADRRRRNLRGDLDNIVMKALRKDPERRYSSVEKLSEDLLRHLKKLPVAARPDSIPYRATRFVQRHRALVAMTVLTTVALVTFSIVAVRARQHAELEAAKARAINGFMQSILSAANAPRGGRRDISVLEALTAATGRIESSFRDQPETEAAVRHTIGVTLMGLAEYDGAEAQLATARRILLEVHGARHPELAETLYDLGVLSFQRGAYEDAERKLREAAAIQREHHLPGLSRTLHLIGASFHERGLWADADRKYREALSLLRRSTGNEDLVARVLVELGILLDDRGPPTDAAEAYYRRAASLSTQERPNALAFLGSHLIRRDRLEEAEDVLSESHALLQERFGDESNEMARHYRLLGELERARGHHEAATSLFRKSWRGHEKLLGPDHPEIADVLTDYGTSLGEIGDYAEAEAVLTRAYQSHLERFGPEHQKTLRTRRRLLEVREAAKRHFKN